MADVRVLDRMAGAAADPAEARRLRQAADLLMIRLSVLLEREGRPLAAQAFAARRAG